MSTPTLLFIHGTGVRDESYLNTYKELATQIADRGLPLILDGCMWSDNYGIDFAGRSLPQPPPPNPAFLAEKERWEYLAIDPLFDLKLWCTPASGAGGKKLGATPAAKEAWEDTISVYAPTPGFDTMLQRAGVKALFQTTWDKLLDTGIPEQAFLGGGDEDAAISRAFAEALVAQLTHDAAAADPPIAVPFSLRHALANRLLLDWEQAKLGIKDLINNVFGRATRTIIRPIRATASKAIAPAIGDVLNYVAVGQEIRNLIRKQIDDPKLPSPVFVLAHSLGGIAAMEMLVESCPAKVKGLITAGSQSPLLFEFGALQTLAGKDSLPRHFPPWINFYDENDLLSYCANPIFPHAVDVPVDSLLPPLEAHSAYWKQDVFWDKLTTFVNDNKDKQ